MRIVMVLLIITTFYGCNNEPRQTANKTPLFDLPSLINTLRVNMTAKKRSVSKTFTLNNKTESKTIAAPDSVFWTTELASLKQIDLNAPQIRTAVTINKGKPDSASNLLINKYQIQDANIPLKSMEVYYLNNLHEIKQIRVELQTDNIIANSKEEITLWVNRYNENLLVDSIGVIGSDKTILLNRRDYRSLTKTNWQ